MNSRLAIFPSSPRTAGVTQIDLFGGWPNHPKKHQEDRIMKRFKE